MFFLRTQSRNSLLFIFACSFGIPLLLAIIHILFTKSIFYSVAGLTLFLLGLLLWLRNKNIARNRARLALRNQEEGIPSNQITVNRNHSPYVNTEGGNYNREIGRDYIQGNSIKGDLVTKNITIEGQKVEVSSDYSQTLGDFKEILDDMILKSSNPVEAISQFARELAEELRKQPEIKVYLDAKQSSNEQEVVNKFIIDLLTKSYDQISQINQIIQTSQITRTNQIQRINNPSNVEYIEYYTHNNELDRDTIEYKEYMINLAKDHENMWHFRIQREDDSFLDLGKQRRFSSKDNAIGTAKKKVEQDRIARWKIDGNTSE